jgi:hypothetical protein
MAKEDPVKELIELIALIIVGSGILAAFYFVYELTQRSVVTWLIGMLAVFVGMYVVNKRIYP